MVAHITIIIIFVIWSASNGYAYEYYECSSSWPCGNLPNIGYPFWGGNRHQYCGRPELQLRCPGANDHPVLQIGDRGDDSSVSFLVLGISNNSKKFTTVKLIEEHPNSVAACPTDFIENHVFKDIFKFSPNVSITRLFHDCPGISLIDTPDNDLVTCSDIDNNSRTAYYLQSHSDSCNLDDPQYKDCKYYDAPVLKKELNKLKQGKEALTDVLKQGFEVDFYSTGCINCQNSGGVCGSSSSSPYQFVCYKLRHRNLVTLYGCTSRHSRELLLVYEYIPNGTVADHLFGGQSRSGSRPLLPWSIRMKIAVQTACALSYLHASDIVHRDVKTNNILLDNNFTVKVADFGLSRLFPFDATHVSTAPQGTPGYLDPEYHKCYQVTNKSDVYSFGVVLIELISSLPAIDINRHENEINLSDYAMNRIQKGELETLIDKNLGFESDFKVKRMTMLVVELAFRCLQQEKEVRPLMEEVFEDLKRIENINYETLESEEMARSIGILVEENDIDHHPCSPKSVIENWVSRSSAASDPST